MSLSVTRAEGLTVITVTSDTKSKCPVICQLLNTLCCSSACILPENVKQRLGRVLTVLGTLQILVGLLTVASGFIINDAGYYNFLYQTPFGAGAVFIVAGIGCILADKFPNPCLIIFTVLLNLVSVALAVTVIIYYSMNLGQLPFSYECNERQNYGYYYGTTTTMSPLEKARMDELRYKCEHYRTLAKMLLFGLDVLMIVLTALEICVTISSCVVSLKTLCKKTKEDKINGKDPELLQPMVEEDIYSPAC